MKKIALIFLLLSWGSSKLFSQNSNIDVFKSDGKVGIKDYRTNKVILEPDYESIKKRMNSFFIVDKGYGQQGCFDAKSRKMIIPATYDFVWPPAKFSKGNVTRYFFRVKKNRKWGIVDSKNQVLVAIEHDRIMYGSNNSRHLEKAGKNGVFFLNPEKKSIPVIYDFLAEQYYQTGFVGYIGDSRDFYDTNGKKLFKNCCKSNNGFESVWGKHPSGLSAITNNEGKQGIYDFIRSKWIFPFASIDFISFFDGHYIIKKKGKFGVVNKKNQIKIPFQYDTIAFLMPFDVIRYKEVNAVKSTKPHILVGINGKLGLRSWDNKKITSVNYNEIEHIYGYYYKVKQNNQYQVIDHFGKTISQDKFDHVGYFYDGKVVVFRKGIMSYLSVNGKSIQPFGRASKARGYAKAEDLYKAFARILKSESDNLLMEFCRDLIPDSYSRKFMSRIRFEYRGFFSNMVKQDMTIKKVVKKNFQLLLNFRKKLKRAGYLATLKYKEVKRGSYFWDFRRQKIRLPGTESPGIFMVGDKKIRFKLGELVSIDGFLKSFTKPRLLM